jgi:hypothetical protein
MSILSSITQYSNSLNSNLTDNNKKHTSSKENKKTDMQHASILFTNDVYKKKMFKAQHEPVYKTFESKEEFNTFINNDLDIVKQTNWKQIPLCLKKSLCEDYIMNDSSISHTDKQTLLLKIDNTFLSNAIKYNSQVGVITDINYKLIE